jgi:hypothetical protein
MRITNSRLAAALVLFLSFAACSTKAPEQAARKAASEPEPAQITMFYTSTPVVGKGQEAILCYGVTGTTRLTLEPAEATVAPSPNRCVEVHPAKSRSYTLTARGADGREMSQTVEVRVSGQAPVTQPQPEEAGVQISFFRRESTSVEGGQTFHKLCFQTWNAEKVSIVPPAFPAAKIFQGCFMVAPKQETTYKLTAKDSRGKSITRSITVQP